MLRGVEQARPATLHHHLNRDARVGAWVLVSGIWYKTCYVCGGAMTDATTSTAGEAFPVPPEPAARAYVAFAGGGAKGLVHVGGLRALEQKQREGALDVKGFAGTSAGALVACLAAAGVDSATLVDVESRRNLIDAVHDVVPEIRTLTDLFGRGGWTAIRALRSTAAVISAIPTLLRWILGGVTLTLLGAVTLSAEAWFGLPGAVFVTVMWLGIFAFVAYVAVGLARLDTLRFALSKFLKSRVFNNPNASTEVTFSDFNGVAKDESGGVRPLLKIIASNISRKQLELFSCDTSPSVPVADAVCASVCIPFIFVPWRIKGVRYVDGGVVSNFPAWPFDEEKALDPDALTIGFQIGDPPGPPPSAAPPAALDRPVFWPTAVFRTALFGSRQLSVRAVGRAELITLPTRLGVLDFDLAGDKARQEVADVSAFALTQIDDRLLRFPSVYRKACAQVREEVIAVLAEEASDVLQVAETPGWVRCAVAMPPPADFKHSLATLYGVGYDAFADGSLLWPIDGSLSGDAWKEIEPRFELDPIRRGLDLWAPANAGLRRRLPPNLAWSLRVPMCATTGKRFLVVLVDGSDVLRDDEPTREVIEALIDRIREIFEPVVRRFEETVSNG